MVILSNTKKNKKRYRRKLITQSLIYLIEVGGFVITVISLYSKIETGYFLGWLSEINSFDFLSKITISLALHQLIVFTYVRLAVSARDDANLSISSLIDYALHYNKYGVQLNEIIERCDLFIDKKSNLLMFNENDIEVLKKIRDLSQSVSKKEISCEEYMCKLELIKLSLDFESKFNHLSWKNSFLLNWLK